MEIKVKIDDYPYRDIDCPFANSMFYICDIKDDVVCPERPPGKELQIPKNCPLRNEPIVVTLDEN